jgi:hypothetical protein
MADTSSLSTSSSSTTPKAKKGTSLLGHIRGKSSNKGSLDLSTSLAHLEKPLQAKTDLIDEMKKVVPLAIRAPGIMAIGMQGSGKSTILEALTGVPLSRGTGGLRRPVKMHIVADPTCTKEYVLVSGTDPLLKEDTRRLESAEELPRVLVALELEGAGTGRVNNNQSVKETGEGGAIPIPEEENQSEGGESQFSSNKSSISKRGLSFSGGIMRRHSRGGSNGGGNAVGPMGEFVYVRVVRPSGPIYTVIDFPGFSFPPDPVQEADMHRLLAEENDPDKIILAVVPVTDVFDRAVAIHLAKKIDPSSKRTIGVVTKANLVTKEMGIVEKLQMTNNKALILPLGYIAVCASIPTNPTAKRAQVLEYENDLFSHNPLLKGLRAEHWGLYSLKSLVTQCQTNSITQRIPTMTHAVRAEIAELTKDPSTALAKTAPAPVKFDKSKTSEFFSKLCSEITSVAFDLNDLANGTITREERKLNLGPRFLLAVETREAEARRAMPSCLSEEVAEWLTKELNEFRGVITNADSMMHPIFKKAIRELFIPALRRYAREVMDDADSILKQVAGALVEERFGAYSRLVESLKRDVALVQMDKRGESETLIQRLLEAEVNWIFVHEVDWMGIQKEMEKGMISGGAATAAVAAAAKREQAMDLWGDMGESGEEHEQEAGAGAGTTKANKPFLQTETSRELKAMQHALHSYVRLLLRRVFYAVPMNARNVMMNEFRQDLVHLIAEKYNDEVKLRSLMSEELWVGQSRQQRAERKDALEQVLKKLDVLAL